MSKNEREIWYEPHPVTPERKAELMKAGYKIIDSQFAPDGPTRSEEGPAANGDEFDANAAKAYLTEKGVTFARNIGKEKLKALFEQTKAQEDNADA